MGHFQHSPPRAREHRTGSEPSSICFTHPRIITFVAKGVKERPVLAAPPQGERPPHGTKAARGKRTSLGVVLGLLNLVAAEAYGTGWTERTQESFALQLSVGRLAVLRAEAWLVAEGLLHSERTSTGGRALQLTHRLTQIVSGEFEEKAEEVVSPRRHARSPRANQGGIPQATSSTPRPQKSSSRPAAAVEEEETSPDRSATGVERSIDPETREPVVTLQPSKGPGSSPGEVLVEKVLVHGDLQVGDRPVTVPLKFRADLASLLDRLCAATASVEAGAGGYTVEAGACDPEQLLWKELRERHLPDLQEREAGGARLRNIGAVLATRLLSDDPAEGLLPLVIQWERVTAPEAA